MHIDDQTVNQLISDMIESGETILGWNSNNTEFILKTYHVLKTNDIYCNIEYFERIGDELKYDKKFNKSVLIPKERIKALIRNKNIDDLLN